jgi:hypothetical protein
MTTFNKNEENDMNEIKQEEVLGKNLSSNHNFMKKEKKKNKSIGFWKLIYHFLNTKDKWMVFFAFIGSFCVGISLPLFALFFGESLSNLNFIGSIDEFVYIFYELLLKFIYVGVSMLLGGIMMYFLWSYIGRIIANRFKEEYFRLLLQQEQGFYDKENPYEYFFKLQNQVKTIENGVNFIF